MRLPALILLLTVLVLILSGQSIYARSIHPREKRQQGENFQRLWGQKLIWQFDKLPQSAIVPKHRVPYAGYIYPDKHGGTTTALSKYDRAFHGGRSLAARHEQHDIAATRAEGFFGLIRHTPYWAGHCNGWAAAAIRHAQPQKAVVRNGVRFTPADIKGLLAELYVYSQTEMLGGGQSEINPATFHVVLANWIGRNKHPIAMDTTPGKEVWNYPIYAYNSTVIPRGRRGVEVKLNLGYIYMLDQEHHRAPNNYRFMYFHYWLDLDARGEVVGGRYFNDSEKIDTLWVPLAPAQGGKEGNEAGNPHLDMEEVLALWRQSCPAPMRENWHNIDSEPQDPIARQPLSTEH